MKVSKEKGSKGEMFFVCDRTACAKCSPDCSHTSNIAHAKNFKPFYDEIYKNAGFMEIDYKPRGVISKTAAPTASDADYQIGTVWIDVASARAFVLTRVTGKTARWIMIGQSPDDDEQAADDKGGTGNEDIGI